MSDKTLPSRAQLSDEVVTAEAALRPQPAPDFETVLAAWLEDLKDDTSAATRESYCWASHSSYRTAPPRRDLYKGQAVTLQSGDRLHMLQSAIG